MSCDDLLILWQSHVCPCESLKTLVIRALKRLRCIVAWIERAWSAYYRRSKVCGIGHRGHKKPFLLLLERVGINNSVGIDGVATTSEIEAGASHNQLNLA